MPVLQAHKISYQFDNGDTLFHDISCSLSAQRVGLVGRNGVGKSFLANILSGQLQPSSGTVVTTKRIGRYSQLPSHLLNSEMTVAEFLGYDRILNAIEQIESGDCSTQWFEIVGDDWQLKQALTSQLSDMGLPESTTFLCRDLSGGQLARLQLWALFQSNAELLILDEPSNHLDQGARDWLVDQMAKYDGQLLLISHDRYLLRQMEQIWELSSLGLRQYGGNFDVYQQQTRLEQQAVERQLDAVRGEQKRLEIQAQKNREKAQQREAQGNKIRKSGSQSKLILDGMKQSAQNSVSNRQKNESGRRTMLAQKQHQLNARYKQIKPQKIYLEQGDTGRGFAVKVIGGVLPYVHHQPFNLTLTATTKLHLSGPNGGGKSTLLKVLLGELALLSGECNINRPVCYLDQHFGLLRGDLSLLENMTHHCLGLLEKDARTLLAGIGFRRDSVFRLASQLSGGEKMKLAMLIVSHQPQSPVLLLDEPDNHLDLDSKGLLADALSNYHGAFVLVSHDEDFVQDSQVEQRFRLQYLHMNKP